LGCYGDRAVALTALHIACARTTNFGGLDLLKRRELLQAGAAVPVVAADAALEAAGKKHKKHKGKGKHKKTRSFAGMNVVLFITDQQRAITHFPQNWAKDNLPGFTRLQQNGLSFSRAFCNSCMCSPSRATLFTGYFPAQHGVKYTLEEDMSPSNDPPNPQVELPLDLPNLATMMSAAGYHVPFKGKWHLSKTIGGEWVPEVVNQYGFERWNPPDAGANQDIDQFGGGDPNNDGRFMEDQGPVETGNEGVFEYLRSVATQQQPFFLVVSLVNPHDVLSYPINYDAPDAGYDSSDLVGDIGLPETVDEDLSTKPAAQQQLIDLLAVGLGPLGTDQRKLDYLNFYGNLMKESDDYLVQILNTLDEEGLTDKTLVIQTSDHGEVGLAHNGMRQKNFNFYEETLRVELVYSNPKLFKKATTSSAMVSHVDFLPTIANLLAVPQSARQDWQGIDYSRVVGKPKKKKRVQQYVVFTYDDWQAGQVSPPYVDPPNHIVSIREGRYKLAKYFGELGEVEEQWEMYDLKHDKNETKNIAWPDFPRNKKQKKELNRLTNKLADVEASRLQPL
jgi:choline-sulfatase